MSQIKLVVFDMDGTILEPRSSWAMIHEHFGTDNTKMLQLYINHKISDEEFKNKYIEALSYYQNAEWNVSLNAFQYLIQLNMGK